MKKRVTALAILIISLISLAARAQDADGDLMPDSYETAFGCLMPNTVDAAVDYDADGLTSLAEYTYSPLLNPCLADTDLDLINDGDELTAGSNPLDEFITPNYVIVGDTLKIGDRAYDASLAWNGAEFGLAWNDADGLMFSRISAAGGFLTPDQLIEGIEFSSTVYRTTTFLDLEWIGAGYSLSYTDHEEIYGGTEYDRIFLRRLESDGSTTGIVYNHSADRPYGWPYSSHAWTGSEFGLTWVDTVDGWTEEVLFTRVSAAGVKLGDTIRVTDNGNLENLLVVPVAYTGPDPYVEWLDPLGFPRQGLCYFDGLDWRGCVKPTTLDLADGFVFYGDMAGQGAEEIEAYKVTLGEWASWQGDDAYCPWEVHELWGDGPYAAWVFDYGLYPLTDGVAAPRTIYISCWHVNPDAVPLVQRNSSDYPSVLWTGSEFAIGAGGRREGESKVFLHRLSASGKKGHPDLTISDNYGLYSPALAMGDSALGMAYKIHWPEPDHIDFSRVSLPGSTVSSTLVRQLGEDSYFPPALARGQNEFGMAWREDEFHQLYPARNQFFARVSDQGALIGRPARLTDNPLVTDHPMDVILSFPSLAWTGSEYGYTWTEQPADGSTPFLSFARLGFDADGDGLGDADEPAWSTNPADWDSDNDGMPDGFEARYSSCGLLPLTPDSGLNPDSDGLTNLQEYQARTNPCLADTDGGGENDDLELAFGRDPLYPFDDRVHVIIGTGSGTAAHPLATSAHDARTQTIYLASEINLAGEIESVALDVVTPPGQTMNNFTARLRHTPLAAYPTQDPAWETAWAVAYQGATTIAAPGWSRLDFTTPFYYNGADNLMLDLSFNNASASTDGTVNYSNPGGKRVAFFSTNSLFGDPLLWSGPANPAPTTTNKVPNLELIIAPDTDRDGAPNWWERQYGCLDANSPDLDSDTDGLPLRDEFDRHTDPCSMDTDNDGLIDGEEVLTYGTDPLDPDSDDDGLEDGDEVYNHNCDPLDPDTDDDGLSDGDEVLVYLTFPFDADSDNDGLTDGEEVLIYLTEPRFPDTDFDGLNDGAEILVWGTDPFDADSDDDTLTDGAEVNTYGTNPLLPDTDLDGMGDAYEVAHPCLDPLLGDTALDGDTDGLSNIAERDLGTDPCDQDTDDDELPDAWEYQYLGCGFDPNDYQSEIPAVKIVSDRRVTLNGGISSYASLVWTGTEYGLSWHDRSDGNYEIYFARLSADGLKLGADLRVTSNSSTSIYPSLSWSGSEYGVSWQDQRDGNYEIYFARLSALGSKLGADLRVTSNSSSSDAPSLSWTGTEYGVSWYDRRDGNPEIYFARISGAGAKIGSDLRVTSNGSSSFNPSLSWTGSEYGVSWHDARNISYEIYFARISALGSKLGSDVRVTNNPDLSYDSCLSWTGTEYGVSWRDDRDGNPEIFFARISGAGAKIGSDLQVSGDSSLSYTPSLSWTGSEYGVSWHDSRDGNYEIYLGRISAAGVKIGSDLRLTRDANYSLYPSLLWNGSDYAVNWHDDRDANDEIYFARIQVGEYTDKDGDGLREDDELASGTDPCDPDTDDDLLSDHDEVNLYGTNPLSPDTDGDGMGDADEVARPCLDPMVGDSALDGDTDGLSNIAELGLGTEPCDKDTDQDGLPDGWENQSLGCGFNPLSPDSEKLVEKFGPDQRVTSDAASSWSPSISWTGSEYGVSWFDRREGTDRIFFTRISAAGSKIGSDLRVSDNPNWATSPSLSWTGSEYGVTWDNVEEIYFSRFSASGLKLGSDLRVTNNAGISVDSSLSWTGSEFGVSWHDVRDGNYEIYFARISAAGSKLGSDLRVTSNASSSAYPSLSWTGSEYGVSWYDIRSGNYEIYFARISAGGLKLGSDLRVTSNSAYSYNPSLSWTGSEFGVSWYDIRDGNYEIYFTRLSAGGLKIGSDLRMTSNSSSSSDPSLRWNGSEYGVSWIDSRDGNNEIYFCHFSAAGVKIGSDLRVTSNGYDSIYPSLVWTGSEYGVSWRDDRDGNTEIYFARITLPYTDKDSDGLREDDEFASGTDPCNPDTDGDGMGDGFEVDYEICAGLDPLLPGATSLDGDSDGLSNLAEFNLGTDPCDPDTDGDGGNDGIDCAPLDHAHWSDCGACVDADNDDYGPSCDLGADCDDDAVTGPGCHDACSNFYQDGDADGYGNASVSLNRCAAPTGYVANSTDCSDANTNAWDTCATCIDADADGWYQLCNRYQTVGGPDCDDLPATGGGCHNACSNFYQDGDADGYGNAGVSLNRCAAPTGYVANSADCSDANTNAWSACATCIDADADGWYQLCNRYLGINGPDCDDNAATGGSCHNACSNFYQDGDADAYGNASVFLSRCTAPTGYVANNTDCSDVNPNAWDACATCIDVDADGWYRLCNRYQTVSGPDCDDNAATGGSCHDACSNFYQDGDADAHGNAGVSLNRCTAPMGYVADNTDCSDVNAYAWNTCATCNDDDIDTYYELCNRYGAGVPPLVTIGAGTGLWAYPLMTNMHDARTQVIYLAAEIGGAGAITAVALDVAVIPGQVMNNFTIRMKHAILGSYSTNSWEGPASGWITVYQNNEPRGVTGWRTFTLSTPFNYDGTSNLMVDFSFNNSSYSSPGANRYTNSGANRTIYYPTNSGYGDPLNWTGTSSPTPSVSTYVPNLRLSITAASINGPDCDDAPPTGPTCHDNCPNFFADADADSFGAAAVSVVRCVAPFGYVAIDTDCNDASNTVFPAASELCDLIDNQCPGDSGYGIIDEGCVVDTDGDGLTDNDETAIYFTDPNDPDSDDDGLDDGDEVLVHNTNPNAWDTDGDYLPDPFEIANAANPAGPLDATSASDGNADFEPTGQEDGNPNYHEYWNGSNLWAKDPTPDRFANPSCYYWAEGDGDGVPGPGDLSVVKDEVATGLPTYLNVLPRGVFDTQDIDKDGVPGPGDIASVQGMLIGVDWPSGYPAMPVSLGVFSAPGGAVDVGDTCHVTVEVVNQALAVTRSGSFAVVFSIDPSSTGSAVLLGGEGEDLGQGFANRYDVSGLSTAGGKANIVLKVTGAGTVIVRAKIPACGTGTIGRWCSQVLLSPSVSITVQ